ncbi:aminoglycoside phosphotransferase family protein [Rhizobium sp. KVB221]|uniref:Aminoglycoside phosphotransferase family protein n=1 Tax=Rhizobium setariae TaxID=2801340 RepID=A0A936YV82_9HYPH|nr:aminoglycoside phosphotransferase family protein [Rhizobium setariae]MBL0374206.1 aminoglycoside phosphotransferase family protein [Rhizobium setariae]
MSRMHADELLIDELLAGQLMSAQFPQWAGLVVRRVPSAGTDNALFRLGDTLVGRFPRFAAAADQAAKELRWLPVLAPHLPLAVPMPLARGAATEAYPFVFTICNWIEGQDVAAAPLSDLPQAAGDLAQFIKALQSVDSSHGPLPGNHNFGRGVALTARDNQTRTAIADLEGIIDTSIPEAIWTQSLTLPAWQGNPVWIHGDIHPGNLIANKGQLCAVIDFGGLAVGDPATDLMVAWTLLTVQTRPLFRALLQVDDATWLRGRAWALSVALVALPYYINTNPALVSLSRRAIEQVAADFARGSA